MKYVFFGTPEFAKIVLEKLIAAGCAPEAVVCNPDEPVGRKQILTPPPVKVAAEKNDIQIFQPENLRGNFKFAERLKKLAPDLAIVAAYGKIIPKEILDISRFGFLNIHGSLLPAYRGASPIQSAILNGEKETGVTIMRIDEEMDHGPLLGKSEIRISKSETYGSLSQKLAILGAELLIKVFPDYISGKIKPVEQNHSEATYTKIVKKKDGRIDWTKSAEEIERMTRAFYPWPAAWTVWNGKTFHPAGDHPKSEKLLKITETEISEENNHQIGEIFLTKNNQLAVKCGVGSLVIKKLQLEGGKVLSAREFLNGHKDFVGSVLQ
ncbi:methionyl-tRNA formyltransferase [Candidatus Wolfebacteria bacterium]|nr:methionyl-tRNA formyltransferase [Candidatus Wolfebacteria bacterium]